MFDMSPFLNWLGKIITAIAMWLWLAMTAGCVGPGMLSPVSQDIKELLKEPAVQKTLQEWSADAEVNDPRLTIIVGTIVEIRAGGVSLEGSAKGRGDED